MSKLGFEMPDERRVINILLMLLQKGLNTHSDYFMYDFKQHSADLPFGDMFDNSV